MRVNLGSGQRKFGPGWINVDSQKKWEPDFCADGEAYLRCMEPRSVDLIVLHHVVEHYGCGEATGLIAECARVLKNGASLLVFVPDMNELARMWIEGRLSTQVYMTNVYGAYMSDEADRHKWGYDRSSLYKFLRDSAEWGRVQAFDWREIEGASLAKDRWILAMQAIR